MTAKNQGEHLKRAQTAGNQGQNLPTFVMAYQALDERPGTSTFNTGLSSNSSSLSILQKVVKQLGNKV